MATCLRSCEGPMRTPALAREKLAGREAPTSIEARRHALRRASIGHRHVETTAERGRSRGGDDRRRESRGDRQRCQPCNRDRIRDPAARAAAVVNSISTARPPGRSQRTRPASTVSAIADEVKRIGEQYPVQLRLGELGQIRGARNRPRPCSRSRLASSPRRSSAAGARASRSTA